jgi:hypothetical protein
MASRQTGKSKEGGRGCAPELIPLQVVFPGSRHCLRSAVPPRAPAIRQRISLLIRSAEVAVCNNGITSPWHYSALLPFDSRGARGRGYVSRDFAP